MTPAQKEKELRILFDRWLNNASDEASIRQLVDYAGDEEITGVWDSLLAGVNTDTLTGTGDNKHSAVLDRVYRNLLQSQPGLENKTRARRIPLFTRYAAAVLIILAAGTAAWFIFHLSTRKAEIARTILKNDVSPGKSGAILTLGNGQQIVLDSMNNGVIATQNGANVVLKDGQVAYNKNKAANAELTYNTMSTPRGRKYQLTLSDGTQVWLNAASSVTFPAAFTGPERMVSITGEAYFEVARNHQKPFFVNVNGMKVEVLGTHFNINAYSDEAMIKTTLLQGSIRVSGDKIRQVLVPGQQAQLSPDKGLKLITDIDIAQEMAWRNDEFYFKYTDLKTVMRQLARWYDLEIVYENGDTGNLRFDGEIPMDAMVSQVLTILEKSGIHFHLEGKKLTILP